MGTLAVMGPLQHEAFSSWQYVEVARINDGNATVKITGPEPPRLATTVEIPSSVLASSVISVAEANWWPGSYLSTPVTFVLPGCTDMGNRCYDVVTAYAMDGIDALLVVRCGAHSCRVKLTEPSSIIKVEPLMYALQSGSGVRSAGLNATEMLALLQRLNHKRKRDLLSNTATVLTAGQADETRQIQSTSGRSDTTQPDRPSHRGGAEEIDGDFLSSDPDNAIMKVRHQNEPLTQPPRRLRRIDNLGDEASVQSDAWNTVSFRPSAIESQVHDAITNPAYAGKDAPALLEYWRRSDQSRFLTTPPTCRGLYDIGFGARDLSIMHLTTDIMAARVHAKEAGNLRVFAMEFYKSPAVNFIDKALLFLSRYGDDAHLDSTLCKVFVFWIDSKRGKFRTRLLAGGISEASLLESEFIRNDEELAELMEYFARGFTVDQPAQATSRIRRNYRRGDKPPIYGQGVGVTLTVDAAVDTSDHDATVDAAIYYARKSATQDAIRARSCADVTARHHALAHSHGLDFVNATEGDE
ncbi:hypothetical protein ON010_g13936 [Phytophthora cinnamomi]|nr:hypothetical protein ON010_g13936 [Phytophthora cinnamomi]